MKLVKISLLSNFMDHPKNCYHLPSRYQTWSLGYLDKEFLNFCSYAVSEAIFLQDEAKKEHNKRTVSLLTKNGLLLILNTLMKWIYIYFWIPRYFFKVSYVDCFDISINRILIASSYSEAHGMLVLIAYNGLTLDHFLFKFLECNSLYFTLGLHVSSLPGRVY